MPELPAVLQRVFVEVFGAEAAQKKLKRAVDDVDSSITKLDKDVEGAQKRLSGMGAVSDQVGKVGKAAKEAEQEVKDLGTATDDTSKKTNIFGESTEKATQRLNKHADAIKAGVAAHQAHGKAIEASTKRQRDNIAGLNAIGIATDGITPKILGMSKAQRDLESSELNVASSHEKVTRARSKLEEVTKSSTSTNKDHIDALSSFRRAELSLGDALDMHRSKVSAVNKENEKSSGGLNRIKEGLTSLGASAKGASGGFSGLMSTMTILKGPGIIVGINLIVSGLSALAGSAFSLISALGPLAGLLGALPGAAIGLGAAFATVKLAFSDVGKAMKAHDAQEGSSAASTKATAAAHEAAAERVREATRSRDRAVTASAEAEESAKERVTQAEADAAQAVIDASESIEHAKERVTDAHDRIGEAAERASEMVVTAGERVTQANDRLTQANTRATQAQEDLNRARLDAAEALQQLNFQAQGAALSQESAQISLIEAQDNYDKVMKSRASTDMDKRRAALQLHQAELGLAEATDRNKDTAAKLNDENAKGVEGSDRVQSALDAQKEAAKGVADAQKGLTDATKDQSKAIREAAKLNADAQKDYGDALKELAKTQVDANDRVTKANKNVEDSEKALAKARRDGADSVAEAERELTQAIKAQKDQMTSSTGAADKYKEALAKLTPEARAFVTQLEATKKQMEGMSKAAQAGLLPGLTEALRNVTPLWPVLTGVIKETGQALGDVARNASQLVGSRDFGTRLAEIAHTNAQAFRDMGGSFHVEGTASSGLTGMVDAFVRIGQAAQPLIKWIGELVRDFGLYIDKVVIAGQESGRLGDFFKDRVIPLAIQVGHIFRDLTVGIFNMGKVASGSGQTMLDSMEKALAKFREWTASVSGENRLRTFFESSRESMAAFMHLLGEVAKGFGAIADPGSLVPLIQAIEKQLLPPLMQILNSMKGSDFGPQLINLLEQILKLAAQFAGSSGPLSTYLTTLTELMKVVNWLVDHIPGMKEIFFLLTTGWAAKGALDLFLGPFSKIGVIAASNKGLIGGFSNAIKFLPGELGAAVGPMAKLGEGIGKLATKFGSAALEMVGFKKAAKEVAEAVAERGVGEALTGGITGAGAEGLGGAAAKKAGKKGAEKAAGKVAGEVGGAVAGGALAEGGIMATISTVAATTIGGITVGTIAAVAAIVAVIVGALALLYFHFKPFRDLIDSIWQSIQKLWDIILAFLGDTVSNVAQWSRNVGKYFTELWGSVLDGASAFWQALQGIWDTITTAFVNVWHAMYAVWDTVGRPIFEAIQFAIGLLVGFYKLQFDFMVAIVKDAFEVIGHLWDIFNVVLETIGKVVKWLAEEIFGFFFGMISDTVDQSFHQISLSWDFLHGIFDVVAGAVGWLHDTIFKPIFEKISQAVDLSFKAIGSVWDWLRTNVFDKMAVAFGLIQSAWDNTAGKAFGAMRSVFEWIRDNAGKIWGGLGSAISGAFSGVVDRVRGAIGPIANIIGTVANAIGGILTAVGLNNVGDFLRGVGSDLKGFAAGREVGGKVPAAARGRGRGRYDDAPMVEVGPGFVTAGVRAIVGEGNPAHPEFVIPTDPRHRKRAVGLFAQLGKALELMQQGGRVPAAALGLGNLPGAGIVRGVGGALGSAWDWTKGLAANAWTTATGLVRKGSAWALERAWPTAPNIDMPLADIIPRSWNGTRDGVLNWVRGREDPNSEAISIPAGTGMAAGGRIPRYAAGGRMGLGSRYRVRAYQTGGETDPATTTVAGLGMRTTISTAFNAMGATTRDSLQMVSDGLSTSHTDLVGVQEGTRTIAATSKAMLERLDAIGENLAGKLDILFPTVTAGLTTLQTEVVGKVDALIAKLVEVFGPLQASVDLVKVGTDTIVTTIQNAGIGNTPGSTLPASATTSTTNAPVAPAPGPVQVGYATPGPGEWDPEKETHVDYLVRTQGGTAPGAPSAPSTPPIDKKNRTAVRNVQQALNKYGAALVVDGIWGPKTQAAYGKYGHQAGMYAKGGKLGAVAIRGLGDVPLATVGAGMVVNRPRAIVGEGRGGHPEYVIPTDPKYRKRALALWAALGRNLQSTGATVSSGGLPHLAAGDVLAMGGMDTGGGGDLGIRVALREAFDAMASLVTAGLQMVSDGLSTAHTDLVAIDGDLKATPGPIVGKIGELWDNLNGFFSGALQTLFTNLSGTLTTLQTEVNARLDAVLLKLADDSPLLIAVGMIGTLLTTIDTFTRDGLLPALTGEGGIRAEITKLIQPLADIYSRLGDVNTGLSNVQSAVGSIQAGGGGGGVPAIGGGGGGVGAAPSIATSPPPPAVPKPAPAPAPPAPAGFASRFPVADTSGFSQPNPRADRFGPVVGGIGEGFGLMPMWLSQVDIKQVDQLKQLQQWLNDTYHWKLAVDGIWGPKTQQAYQYAAAAHSGGKVPLPPYPKLARGGKTDGPAMVGEGNRAFPEYVIPTDPMHRAHAQGLFAALAGELGVSIGRGKATGVSIGAADLAGDLAGDTVRSTKDLAYELRRQTRALEQLVALGQTQKGKGGVTFEEGAFQVQANSAEEAVDTLGRRLQMLASVGVFG